MNDQHPHAGHVGDDAYATGSFQTSDFAYQGGSYEAGSHETGHHQVNTGTYYATGSYETGTYSTGTYDTGAYPTADPLYGNISGGYDTGHSGQYDTTQWADTTGYATYADQSGQGAQADQSGQWDASAWNQPQDNQQWTDASAYDTTGQWYATGAESFETGSYDATAWNYATEGEAVSSEEAVPAEAFVPEQYDYSGADEELNQPESGPEHEYEHAHEHEHEFEQEHEHDGGPSTEALAEPVPATPVATPRPVRRSGGSRGRRRTPAKRSALLTVAVPSACVMGVAGIAAASVSGIAGTEKNDDDKTVTAADPSSVKPAVANSALDTQLAALDADALDFSDRASRTQERIDLKARQEAERKKREEEAKRREALRPKFALPVELRRLSARYGQAGINWMSLHSGIDFPVQYGTPVMAATDGTVRTQWNSAYGNMVIVTAKDGTETWYCHLSSAKIRSGPVKAGDVIAYSGNSGNSTGPHLHFEVRPGGGAAIDPEQWLRSHGLSPTG
ncbi:M23 family metallopeptidase [Streptomyces sp. TRM49041]|uniref:M23 family metallopeptidase n=1 Tax=Streptomyces sp. TRM49041 TaxID=2603216 RepID=UPI0011ED4555|nr:M23 family metallopeptidase [Streptomyces sp. TRM49041]